MTRSVTSFGVTRFRNSRIPNLPDNELAPFKLKDTNEQDSQQLCILIFPEFFEF